MKMKKTTHQNLWDAVKEMCKGKCVALKCLIRKKKDVTSAVYIFILKIQKKKSMTNLSKQKEGSSKDQNGNQ